MINGKIINSVQKKSFENRFKMLTEGTTIEKLSVGYRMKCILYTEEKGLHFCSYYWGNTMNEALDAMQEGIRKMNLITK